MVIILIFNVIKMLIDKSLKNFFILRKYKLKRLINYRKVLIKN
jgi:hypothetical protein